MNIRMLRTRTLKTRLRGTAALALLPLLALTACGSGGTGGAAAVGAEASPAPTDDPVATVRKVDSAAALLPAGVRKAGKLRVGSSVGFPPGAYYPNGTDKAPAGQDIDLADAVAKVLGVGLERQDASFEAILPALGSGKYDVGASNFGVTDERRRIIDFVTYINDGQGFATRKDSKLSKVTDLKQLCGLNVATGAGTTFEATLEENKKLCTTAGKKPYTVQTYSETGAIWSSLQQGRSDVVMSTINGLRYAVAQQQGVKFLNEYHRLDVGFAFKKGTKLAPAFQSAVNKLIADGTYEKILKKWGTTGSAITKSQISPPELKN